MKQFTKYFFNGLLTLMPVVATLYVVYIVFDGLNDLVFERMGEWVAGLLGRAGLQIVASTALGIVATVGVIFGVGVLASNFLGRQLVQLVERMFEELPLVKLLYGAIKDLLGAFVGNKKGFEVPVAVSMTGDEAIKILGFVTRESLDFLGLEGQVAVYVPQSYNFAGQLLVVPADRVQRLKAESSDVMKFLVSGGVSS